MYRLVDLNEIKTLELRGCSAEDWNRIEVKDPFYPDRLRNVKFAGNVQLGINEGSVTLNEYISKPSGITNCYIKDCTIGDNVFLSDIGILANYRIGNSSFIENAGTLAVFGKTAFGNGYEINILNESGGRELMIFDRLSSQIAYLIVVYRHNPELIKKLKALISEYAQSSISVKGSVGEYSIIRNTQQIINTEIGSYCKITGALSLEEGTVKSNISAPVIIGEGVTARNFIILSGSKIENGAILTSTFIGEGVLIGKQFSADNSAFFANCEAYHGEACSIFAGPYTVTHHKSTLLIAGMFSFFNAGSGTNQSNHMYKLGPVHHGIVERGSKTGSFSYMLWPSLVGAFTVVMDKHAGNFDSSELPFSYISAENGKSVITPAMNLFTVGTARDSKKWPVRDRRTDIQKTDLIDYELFNPCTVQKMIRAVSLLEGLYRSASNEREFIYHRGLYINRLMLRTSKRFYELAINIYLCGEIVKKLEQHTFKTFGEVRKILRPPKNVHHSSCWTDIGGMITLRDRLDELTESLITGKTDSLEKLNREFRKIHSEKEENNYSWCADTLQEIMGIRINSITKATLKELISTWKESTLKFNKMVLKDAEKEFDQLSRIAYGPDGDNEERLADFEAVRGRYETNSFIAGIQKESETTEERYNKLLNRVEVLTE
jgi:acetyltransferase-like isoleucine patch superfamily enzyme